MIMKLNQILYQRSKDWLENRPKTGILNMLGRVKPDKGNEKERNSFDDYLRGHIKTSNKTINIRGLFRVPDVSGGERLMINAEEKENTEQNEYSSIRGSELSILEEPSENDYKTMEARKYITHVGKTKTNTSAVDKRNISLEKENFIEDDKPLSLNDYVNYIKDNPSKTIAVMNPKTGYPKIVLKNHKGVVKL